MMAYAAPTLLLVWVHSPTVAFGIEVVRGVATLVVDVLAMTALQRSLALMPLRPFWHAAPGPGGDGVVVGYAAAPEHAYGQALSVLGDVLAGR